MPCCLCDCHSQIGKGIVDRVQSRSLGSLLRGQTQACKESGILNRAFGESVTFMCDSSDDNGDLGDFARSEQVGCRIGERVAINCSSVSSI